MAQEVFKCFIIWVVTFALTYLGAENYEKVQQITLLLIPNHFLALYL